MQFSGKLIMSGVVVGTMIAPRFLNRLERSEAIERLEQLERSVSGETSETGRA
jgi:hypothetical protein